MESAFVIVLHRASQYLHNDTKETGDLKKVIPFVTTERKRNVDFTEDKNTLTQRRKHTNGINSDNEQVVIGRKRHFYIIPWLALLDFVSLLISLSLFVVFNCNYWKRYEV